MYRLAVFDIDRTLSMEKNIVPESTLIALDKMREKGIHCLLATGRGPKFIEAISETTGIKNYVALNGQYVFFEGEVLYKYIYPHHVINKVAAIADKVGCCYGLITSRGYYISNIEDLSLGIHKDNLLRSNAIIETITEEDEVNQIIVFCSDEKRRFFDDLKKEYVLTSWNSGGFDVLHATRSKAEGIKEIAEKLGIPRVEIISFGDADNDIEMIEYSGMGVAMGNSKNSLKAVADYITKSLDEGGIYHACVELGVI